MKNMLIGQNSEIVEHALGVKEDSAKYATSFQEAVDKFAIQLEYIERRCQDALANPDEMLILTTKAMMDMCNAAERLEIAVNFDAAALKEARIHLRERTNLIFSRSFFNRGRTWPQGHPGDYSMIEFLYRNTPVSNGIGAYLDRYFLATTLSVAVRERKETLRDLLADELKKRSQPRILDVACGSCRELLELASDIERTQARVTCIDFDSDALDFALQRISHVGTASESMAFRKYNALKMVNHERNVKEFGMQDVIYSVGFFDYLDDELLVRLLGSLFALLSPGGTLIASFKDCRRYRTFDTSWLLDWDAFYQRTEENMWDLLSRAGIPRTSLTMTREKSGVIVFFLATK